MSAGIAPLAIEFWVRIQSRLAMPAPGNLRGRWCVLVARSVRSGNSGLVVTVDNCENVRHMNARMR